MAFGALPENVPGGFPTEGACGIHGIFARLTFLGMDICSVILVVRGAHGQTDAIPSGGLLFFDGAAWAYLSGTVCGLFVGGAAVSFGRI